MLNAITFDVEEWFQVTSFNSVIKISNWNTYESRVLYQTEKLLDILLQYNIKATFFVLGYVAEKYPEIVKNISDNGHELGIHGYSHKLVCNLSPEEFTEEVLISKKIVEQISGQKVLGYRAPSFSITDNCLWAFDILEENGFKYDSSIIPGKMRFGISDAERYPYNISKKGKLIEFPISTMNIFGNLIPFSGGFFLRFFPDFLIKYNLKQINSSGNSGMFYLHPWELDVDHPKISVSLKTKFIHYFNLKNTEKKLKSLFNDFDFGTVKEVLQINN